LNVSVFRFACECLGIDLDIEELERTLVLALMHSPLGGLCPPLLVGAAGQVIEVRLDLSIFVDAYSALNVAVLLVLCP